MKKIFLVLILGLFLTLGKTSSAEEDWIYAVQAPGAKMDKKEQSFSVSGAFAQELKKILPPSYNMITELSPGLTPAMNKNFRAIILKDPAGNGLQIECDSGKLEYVGGSDYVVKEKETVCILTLRDKANANQYPNKNIPILEALQKAQAANQIK